MRFRGLAIVLLGVLVGQAADAEPFARIGSPHWLHPDQPQALAMHPSRKVVVSGGSDGLIRVWETATGKIRFTINRKGLVVALAYSADGRWLAVHFADELVRLFETETYTEEKSVAVRNGDLLSLSRDGKLLVASGPLGQPVLLETENGQDRMELPKGRVAAIRPDGGAVAIATQANSLQVLEIPSGKPLDEVQFDQTEPVSHLAFSPDGKRIAVAWGAEEAKIRVYEIGKKEAQMTVVGTGPVVFGSETLIGTRNGRIAVWQLKTGKLLHTLGEGVSLVAASADGSLAATDGGAEFPSPRIHLWDLKTGEIRNRTPGEIADLRGILAAPTGDAAIISTAGLIRWQPGVTKPESVVGVPAIRTATVADRSVFVVTQSDKLLNTAKPEKPIADLPRDVRFLASDRAGQKFAAVTTGQPAELLLLDASTGTVTRRWPLPARPLGVALAPDGKLVAVLGRDGYARVWPTNAEAKGQTPEEIWKERTARSFRGSIAFSPDGTRLAFTSLMRVSVHEPTTGKRIIQFDRAQDDGPYTSLAFSPDGRFLAAGTQGSAGGAVVWELLTQQRSERFEASGTVTALAFLDRGQTLLTVGSDDQVKAWDRTNRRGQTKPSADDLARAWRLLGEPNPEISYRATATLIAGGTQSLAFLKERLTEEKQLAVKIEQWIEKLDSKEFAEREKVMKELVAVGGSVLALLDKAAKTQRSAEWNQRATTIRARVTSISASLPDPSLAGRNLSWVRAIAALDQLDQLEATKLLTELRELGGPVGKEAVRTLTTRNQ